MRNRIFLTTLLFILSAHSFGQVNRDAEAQFNEMVQELFQQQEESIHYEDMYESLLQYYTDPLDLNKASREDLQQLYLLSPLQINNLLDHKNNTGAMLSLYELQSIPSFDNYTIQKVLPFISVHPLEKNLSHHFKELFINSNHYLLIRYGKSLDRMQENTTYAGDANKYLIRYRNSKPRDFSYGINMEKDAGEKNLWSPSQRYYGADFLSFHAAVFNKGKIKALCLGDYQLQFGQGLIVSSGLGLGKGTETILTVKKTNAGIRPYNSSSEYGFFRGSAITISQGWAELSVFYSNKKIDGTIQTDQQVFSPVTTGYHRTPTELSKRNKIQEQVLGSNLSINSRSKKFHSGFTLVTTSYEYSLQRSPALYNQFEFSGNNNYTAGLDLNYAWHNFIFFGESAISKSGGKGTVAGFLANLSQQAEVSMVYRNYARDFHSFYSNAFGENSKNFNERGVYWGLKLKPSAKFIFTCYYDRFIFPWLKYLVDAPSKGDEYLGKLAYLPNKLTLVYFQFRQENKEKNLTTNSSAIDYPINTLKRNFLFNAEVKASTFLTTRTRLQLSSYKQANTTFGYAMMNDLDITLRPFALSLRFVLFDTDDFDNRQYMYEKDVLYSFSMPAYYGKGTRVYAMLKFKVLKNIDTWIKYSKTNYMDKESLQAEVGNESMLVKSDLRIQMRYSF